MKTILSLLIVSAMFVSLGCECCKPKPKCEPKKDGATACWRGQNIIAVAFCDKSYSTFIKALKATELNRTLRSPGPYTVFAPTNEAFQKLPAGQLDNWMKPENKSTLKKILLYHIVGGNVSACDARNQKFANTLSGDKIRICSNSGGWMVGNAKVLESDIKACNGIIHKIDTVLIPPSCK
jgi:uncharacterized surface protein with fasciclin (FAS1) repeats